MVLVQDKLEAKEKEVKRLRERQQGKDGEEEEVEKKKAGGGGGEEKAVEDQRLQWQLEREKAKVEQLRAQVESLQVGQSFVTMIDSEGEYDRQTGGVAVLQSS